MDPQHQERYAREYIAITRQHFAAYHDHKEKMAYLTAALYLTGVSVLVFQESLDWIRKLSCLTTTFSLTIFCLTIVSFIWWQLLMRYRASVMVAACDTLRIKWLKDFPLQTDQLDVSLTYYKNIETPQFLRHEARNTASVVSLIFATMLPLVLIVFWTMLLLWRLSITCQ